MSAGKQTRDSYLAEAENALRDAGFRYPLAWMVGFLVDYEEVIDLEIMQFNDHIDRKAFKRLMKEIKTGEVQND